jgi:hypothetical protein
LNDNVAVPWPTRGLDRNPTFITGLTTAVCAYTVDFDARAKLLRNNGLSEPLERLRRDAREIVGHRRLFILAGSVSSSKFALISQATKVEFLGILSSAPISGS